MALDNPELVGVVNDSMRPLSESIRDVRIAVSEMIVEWTGVSATTSGEPNGSILVDGRESQGVSRLKKSDLFDFMDIVHDLDDLLSPVPAKNTTNKPTVRKIRPGS